MSIDPSLKVKGALTRHRNVLTRAERIEILKDEERWSEGDSLLGLQKVGHRKSHAGRMHSHGMDRVDLVHAAYNQPEQDRLDHDEANIHADYLNPRSP